MQNNVDCPQDRGGLQILSTVNSAILGLELIWEKLLDQNYVTGFELKKLGKWHIKANTEKEEWRT